jgi:hypothetical protein
VTTGRPITLEQLSVKVKRAQNQHNHTAVTIRAIRQRSGIPYEVERRVCTDCRRVLDEKPLKRASAS